MTECAGCQHPKAAHGGKGTACRLSKCPCAAFDDGQPRTRPSSRRVAIDVPDGYVVQVALVPVAGGEPIILQPAVPQEATS